jgi:hypothetical protein
MCGPWHHGQVIPQTWDKLRLGVVMPEEHAPSALGRYRVVKCDYETKRELNPKREPLFHAL